MNIAELGIRIDTADAARASAELDKLAQTGARAEQSASSLMSQMASLERTLASGAKSTGDLAKQREQLDKLTKAGAYSESEFAKIAAQLDKQQIALVKSSLDEQKALNSLLNAIDPARAAMAKLDQQVEQLGRHFDSGRLTQTEYQSALAKLEPQINAAEKALNKSGAALKDTGVSAEQTKAALRQLPAQFTDIFTSLAGGQNPLMVLIQQGGQIKDSFGGLDNMFATLKDEIGSFFSGAGDVAGLSANLSDFAKKSENAAESAGNATEGVSDLAGSINDTADAAEKAKTAAASLNSSVATASSSVLSSVAGFAALAAVIATVIYGYNKGSKEADEYNKALILTGDYAGTNANQLGAMAAKIGDVTATTGDAAAALTMLASSGKIAAKNFEAITKAALDMEDATGRAVADTIAEFVKIAEDPVAAAKSLNDQYNFLTASVYSQISALKEQNNTTGAADLLTKAYAETIESRSKEITDNLGYIESAWKGIKDAASTALDSIKSVGRTITIDAQIEDVDRRIAQVQGGFGFGYDKEAALTSLKEQRDMLVSQKQAQADIAEYEGRVSRERKASIDALVRLDALNDSIASNGEKRAKEIAKYRKDLEAIRKADPSNDALKQENVDKVIAGINDKYKDPKASSRARVGAVDLTAFNDAENSLKSILATYENAEKEIEAAQRAGVISQESYAQQRASLLQQEQAEVQNAYRGEIAALEEIKSRRSTSAEQRIQLDQRIADTRSAMVKAQQDADSELQILALNEQGRLAKQTQAVKTYTDALNQQIEALRLQGERTALSVGMGSRQSDFFQQQNALDDRLAQQKIDLANQYGDGSRGMSLDEYNQKLEALEANHRRMTSQLEHNYEGLKSAESDWTNGAKSAFQDYIDNAQNMAGQTYSLLSNAFSGAEDALTRFVTTGKLSFRDFANSIIQDLARIAIRQAATGLFSSALGAATSYFGGGGGAATAFAAASSTTTGMTFGGGRASGGSVTPNTFYQVNENGPELLSQGGKTYLMTGAQGGEIKPLGSGSQGMAQGSAAAPVSVNITIASDGTTDVSTNQSGLQQFGSELGTFVEQKYRQLITRSIKPGGEVWSVMNGRA